MSEPTHEERPPKYGDDRLPKGVWVRYDGTMPGDPRIHALADDLGISTPEAIGLHVCVCLGIAQHHPLGVIDSVGERTLETWAGWTGQRGAFARAFRSGFV